MPAQDADSWQFALLFAVAAGSANVLFGVEKTSRLQWAPALKRGLSGDVVDEDSGEEHFIVA